MTPLARFGLAAAMLAMLLAAGCSEDPNRAKQRFFESGNRYAERQQYREAVVEYRNAIQIDGTFGPARRALAGTYERLGDAQNALAEYIRAADLLPDDASVQLAAGNYLLLVRRFEDAKARAEAVLARRPRDAAAHVLLAGALAGLDRIEDAVAAIEKAVTFEPGRAATYASLGMLETKRGRPLAGEAAFRRATELDPQWAPGHMALGSYYWATGNTEAAEAALRKAVALVPQDPVANRALAVFLLMAGRTAEAERFVGVLARSGAAPFALADLYILQNRPADAISELERLRARPRVSQEASRRLARAHAAQGQFGRARDLVDGLLVENPRDAESLLLKGQLLAKGGKPDEALAQFRSAAQLNPESAAVQYALGTMHASRGDLDEARHAFSEALRLNPRAVAAQIAMARVALAGGQAETSAQFAREAVREEPDNRAAQLTLVRSLLATGDVPGAEKLLATLLERDPENAVLHVQRAVASVARRDVAAARQSLDRALTLDPGNAEALTALIALGNGGDNVADLRRRVDAALRAEPTRPDLLLAGARAAITARDTAAAEAFLRRAVTSDPAFLPGYVMLGQLYLSQRRLDDARREFEAIAERQAKPVAARTMLGMIAQLQGNEAAAVEQFERALAASPRAAIAANNLAWILAERGEHLERALQHAKIATEVMPRTPEAQDTLGWVYYKLGRADRAAAAFQEAIRLAPRSAVFHYRLALATAQAGRPAEASEAARRALALNPKFEHAAEARRLVEAGRGGGLP